MSNIDSIIEAIKTGKGVVEIIKELRGKKLSGEEKWYISELLRGYEHEKQTQELRQEYKEGVERIVGEYKQGTERIVGEYKQGTERIVGEYKQGTERIVREYREQTQLLRQDIQQINNHLSNLENATRELYAKIEGFIEGIIVERKR